ncbi:unnamed protein product, partial [Larinioides sclopetarius]
MSNTCKESNSISELSYPSNFDKERPIVISLRPMTISPELR